ncbi:MAG: prefoldin subunit beta [Nitrososphaerota archaeon]|nr:prefoldin subunit beta [Nitrososphaerota archaeon]MDG7038025.1 prefoldin subunit beta [Nitrososphaerota archaeon]MDG7043095.1 prefoldin subunit beta [Nitrososphaerota archaeon]MDG7045387.1 prefoldin subunit beta [Nitrososphaerota archaeon]MDG7046854.1 prefoldin subunit beta [Nitrososphaerota archaeon]
MSGQDIPPWLQEQLNRYQQAQENLEAVLSQKQQVNAELSDINRAIEELNKSAPDNLVYKIAGSIMIKSSKEELLKELEEKRELSNTRSMVLSKQEEKLRASLQELQTKINESLKPSQPSGAQ